LKSGSMLLTAANEGWRRGHLPRPELTRAAKCRLLAFVRPRVDSDRRHG
jgi:hypothetical protein